MATDSSLDLPDELSRPLEHCLYLVGTCGLLRALAHFNWQEASNWDDEIFDDVSDLDPNDREYFAGKFELVLDELNRAVNAAKYGRFTDEVDEGDEMPLVPFASAVHAAHLMARQGQPPVSVGDLEAKTFHQLALRLPESPLEYLKMCQTEQTILEVDIREGGLEDEDWDGYLPAIDYEQLQSDLVDEACLAWSHLKSIAGGSGFTNSNRDTPNELAGPPSARAHHISLFPKGDLTDDPELRHAIITLDSNRGNGRGDGEILREITGESEGAAPKVKALQARIRKARQDGRTTLPPGR